MASTLNTKINSYALERGIEFDQAYTLTPTRTGTNPLGIFAQNSAANIVHEPTVGPAGGSGSWKFVLNSATNQTSFINVSVNANTTEGVGFSDGDWSIGFWFNLAALPASGGSGPMTIMNVTPNTTFGYAIGVGGLDSSTGNAGRLSWGTLVSPVITTNTWHYVAIVKSGTSGSMYYDGQLVGTRTGLSAGGAITGVRHGASSYGASNPTTMNISNYYLAPSSVIGPTEIAEIWNVGSSGGTSNVNVLESPATANADIFDSVASTESNVEILETPATADIESFDPTIATTSEVLVLADPFEPSISEIQPTIVTTTSDSVNITTSIDVTAESVDPLVTTDISISVLLDFSLDASSEFLEATVVVTSDVDNLSEPLTADALMLDATASAEMIVDIGETPAEADAIMLDAAASTESVVDIVETPAEASSEMLDGTASVESNINILETPATAEGLMVDPGNIPLDVLIQETPAIASSDLLDVSIIADKEVVFNAVPAESNFELLLPSWSPPPQAPLYYLPGSLRDKIATYPIEYGIEFGAKTGSPITGVSIYGSKATGSTSDLSTTGSLMTVEYSVDGPPASDADSYLLNSVGALRPYNSTTVASLRPIWQDFNYTIGFWFKINTLPTGNTYRGLTLARIRPTSGSNPDFHFFVTGNTYTGNASRLGYAFNLPITNPTLYFVGPTLNTTDWNYLAIRRTSGTEINNFEVYLNGELVDTRTNTDTVLYPEFEFGENAAANTGNYKIQNLHMATATALTAYEINQIWLAGTIQEPAAPVDAIYPPEPIYVDATIVDGTYIATRPDSVNVATSFPVDAFMVLPAWSNATESRYTADVMELDATFPSGIGVDTFADRIIPVESLTATVDIVDPLLSRFAFTASAILVDPVVSVAPNYLALVKNLDPVFYIQDGQSVPQQLGSWPVSGWEVDDVIVNVTSGEEMTSVGNGKSWEATSNIGGQIPKVKAIVPNYMQRRADLYATRSLSIECWYYSVAAGTKFGNRVESGPIFTDGTTRIAEVFDGWGSGETGEPSNTHVLIADLIKNYDFTSGNIGDAVASWRTYYGQPKRDSWNHVVVTYEPLENPNQVRQKVYLNGSIISNLALNIRYDLADRGEENITFPTVNDAVTVEGPQIGWVVQLSGSQSIVQETGVRTDEFAIYDRTLSENQVYSHYAFMKNLSPNTDYSPIAYGVAAESGDHQVLPVQNALYQETPFSALVLNIPEPVVIGGKSKNLFPEEFGMIEAELLEPTVSLDKVISAEIIPVYAELNNHFVSNNTYYQYVKTNIDPYRYVNFDSSDSLMDHGIDNSYSVIPTSVGGTVVSYDLGINNKSAKTAGLNYATDGVILKESEWNDSWGTGQNSYHSAFWFQRAADDQSINGLRVLWNLNGYKDNQHVVLYQYQGKLHMQFNNGSGTFVEQDTAAIDLFDYNRHFVVVEFDHTNANNNTVRLYVDAVLLSTINLGTYAGSTTNATVQDSGPNFEANNHPRLAVGCLITPFAATALPAVPTNTKLIVDEVYWDKNAITSTMVTNLYNTMPAKTNTVNLSDPLTASAELVMPNVSGDSIFATTSATCDIDIADPTISTTFVVEFTVEAMTANAEINDAERSDSVNIVTEFMLASAALGSFGTPRVLFADTMEASFALQDRRVTGIIASEGNGIRINNTFETFEPITIWANYVTSVSLSEYITPMKEVV